VKQRDGGNIKTICTYDERRCRKWKLLLESRKKFNFINVIVRNIKLGIFFYCSTTAGILTGTLVTCF